MKWRLYERATKSGGALLKTTKDGGGIATSTASGGGSTQTSSAGGGTTKSTSEKTFVQLNLMSGVPENGVGGENYGYHMHEVQIPGERFNHSHSVTISNHQHTVSIPSHRHDISLPDHQHEIELPPHKHDLEYGIFEYDKMPSRLTIKVDGKTLPVTSLSGEDVDLIPYLTKDSEGKVTRDWHTLEIIPNDLARVTASIATQFFVQSRGGGDH